MRIRREGVEGDRAELQMDHFDSVIYRSMDDLVLILIRAGDSPIFDRISLRFSRPGGSLRFIVRNRCELAIRERADFA